MHFNSRLLKLGQALCQRIVIHEAKTCGGGREHGP
jgi:hypothetical protein